MFYSGSLPFVTDGGGWFVAVHQLCVLDESGNLLHSLTGQIRVYIVFY